MCRFFLNGKTVAFGIKLCNAVALRVCHTVTEHGSFVLLLGSFHRGVELLAEISTEENVVSQHQAGGIVANEFPADDEGLGQPIRAGLFGVSKVHAVIAAISEQTLEPGQILRSGDDEDVPDASQHEHGNGVIHHRLIEDR